MSQEAVKISNKRIFTTKELVLTALMAALIAVGSWISVPAEVPFTLQTFAVFCALGLLGGKNGFFAVLVYILLGAVGVPVFAGFTGGIGILFGSTGGYIIGFLFIAAIYWLAELIPAPNKPVEIVRDVIALIIGLVVCYAFGTIWFMHVYVGDDGASADLATAISWCVKPFVIIDLIKLAAAILLTWRLKKYVRI